ncbi:MAG TPA: glycosyltransferase family 87 protein [Caulobacteraceae bacterium]|nr:glycosyltransferase family 87 protein [Caulobacteraceae bacterium]
MRALTFETRIRLAVALGAFAIAYALSAARIGHGAPDFYVFWTAAQHWQTPYDPAIIARLEATIHLGGTWPYAYPPTFLLLTWPFAQLPLSIAYPLWTALGCGVFFYAAAHLVRPAYATALLAITPVVFFAAELGQTSLPVGAAMTGAWLSRDSRPALAGILLGVAACIKPQALVLAPIVFWGRWRMLGWMMASGAALVAASLVFGWQRWAEWPHALASFNALVPATDRINPSALIAAPWWAAIVGALGLYLAVTSRDLVGLVGGALCLAPYAHGYDLAPLTPLAASWLLQRRVNGWGHAIAGGALLAGLVATPAAALAFVAALAVFQSRWWPFRSAGVAALGSPEPAT